MKFISHNLSISTRLPAPYIFSVELTNICNLKCIICPQSLESAAVKRGVLRFDDFVVIFNKINRHARELTLSVGGESLINKDIFRIIEYVKLHAPKIDLKLGTNAVLMDTANADLLLQSGLDEVIFSFDGETKDDYEFIRAGSDFDRTLKNINYFLKKHSEIQSAMKINIQSLRLYSPTSTLDISDTFKERFYPNSSVTYSSYYSHVWSDNFVENRKVPYNPAPHSQDYFPCDLLWKQMSISWDGDVYACCFDLQRTYKVGNIFDQSVMDIWTGAKLAALRKLLIEKRVPPLCKHCICTWEDRAKQKKIKVILENMLRKLGMLL